jgi:transcription initiation factor IIE alpha subunit
MEASFVVFTYGLLSASASALFKNVSNIINHENPIINRILEDLDIVQRCNIVKSIIENLDNYHHDNGTLNIALKGVNDIISKIEEELLLIEKEVKEHEEKWFYSWRTPVYDERIDKVKRYNNILKERVQYMLEIIKLKDNLTPEIF